MSNPTSPLTQIRRQERAIYDETWMAEFLQHTSFGVTAYAVDGLPFVTTNLFVFDPQMRAIYLHSSDQGRTAQNMHRSPRVCFTAAEMGRLLPAEQARGFSVEYTSVVIYGAVTMIDDPQEMLHALSLLMAKYAPHLMPGQDYQPAGPDDLDGLAVYRITVEEWSGKRRPTPDEAPGAYRFPLQISAKSG